MTRTRCATSPRPTAPEALNFSQFAGPPHSALARPPSVCRGGLNARPTTAYSAEREALGAGYEEQQGLRKHGSSARRAQCCLTPRSRRGPTSKRQAREAAQAIIRIAGLAFCCRSRLSSNVRHHNMKSVASPARSAARSAESQAATVRHSREQSAPLVHLHGSGQNRAKCCAPFMK